MILRFQLHLVMDQLGKIWILSMILYLPE